MAIPDEYLVPTVTPDCVCPICFYRAPLLSRSIARRPAVPGDLALCMGCGAINRFDPALELEASTPSELAVLHRQRTKQARMLILAQHFIRQDRQLTRPPGQHLRGDAP